MAFTIFVFIVTLLVLVLIHELGHFLMAKKFGIKVEEFGFGIPPRAWGKKIGETIYSINWLPFGGFVRLLGEDEAPSEDRRKISETTRYFSARPVGQRIAVVVAGVVMNLLLAWVLFYIVLGAQGFKAQFPLLADHQFVGGKQIDENLVLVQQTSENSPAKQAGIEQGDRIYAFNGEVLKDNADLAERTKQAAGKEVTLTISDPQAKEMRDVKITPRANPPQGEGPLGVGLGQFRMATIEYSEPLQRIFAAPIHSWNVLAYTGKIFGNLFAKAVETRNVAPVSQTVSGPVGITSIVNSILTETKNPLLPYLDFVALLSLNLAIMNILPLPALDGGRFFFLLFEAVTRKKVNQDFEKMVHTVGMVVLLTLMLMITFSDIRKLMP